jgi:ferredoxin-like protein FixX
MTYVITEPCIDVKDKTCVGECPVDCIYEGERMLYIHPDECVHCGARARTVTAPGAPAGRGTDPPVASGSGGSPV